MESLLSEAINYVKLSNSDGAIFKFRTHLTHKNSLMQFAWKISHPVLTVMAQNCLTTNSCSCDCRISIVLAI